MFNFCHSLDNKFSASWSTFFGVYILNIYINLGEKCRPRYGQSRGTMQHQRSCQYSCSIHDYVVPTAVCTPVLYTLIVTVQLSFLSDQILCPKKCKAPKKGGSKNLFGPKEFQRFSETFFVYLDTLTNQTPSRHLLGTLQTCSRHPPNFSFLGSIKL